MYNAVGVLLVHWCTELFEPEYKLQFASSKVAPSTAKTPRAADTTKHRTLGSCLDRTQSERGVPKPRQSCALDLRALADATVEIF